MQRHHLIGLGLIVLVAVTFFEVPQMDFVDWDDPGYIFDNAHYRPPSLENVLDFWRRPALGHYIPLTHTAWAGLAAIAISPGADVTRDMQPFNPGVFHAANLVMHAANVLLVFGLLRLLGMGNWPSAAGAALFAVHPAQVEAVAWATAFKDVFSGFFALLALWHFLAWARAKSEERPVPRWRYGVALVCFTLAVLSKQTMVVLPAIALALDVGVLRRPWRRSAVALAPWLAPALVGALTTIWIDVGLLPGDRVAWWQRLFVAGDSLAFYLGKLFVPIRQMAHYGRNPAVVVQQWWGYVTWLAAAAFIALLVLMRRRTPELVAAGAVFIVGVSPVLGLVPYYNQDPGTRYMYMSMVGAALAFAWVARRRPLRPVTYAMVAVLALCAADSTLESFYWHGSVPLFERNLELNPRSWAAHSVLGKYAGARGDLAVAEAHYRAAIEADPDQVVPHLDLGTLLLNSGRTEEAVEHFRAAVAVNDLHAMAHYSLGAALLQDGRPREALPELQRALELAPDMWKAHYNLGVALQDLGETDAAIEHFRVVTEAAPGYALGYAALGLALREAGREDEARRALNQSRWLGLDVDLLEQAPGAPEP